MKLKLISVISIFIFLIWNCSESDGPSEPKSSDEAEIVKSLIVEPQEENYQVLEQLLTKMDTASALDSVLELFLKDTLVSWGETSKQGIAIQYKNGIRGGILLDTQDSPDSIDEFSNFEKYFSSLKNNNLNKTKPGSQSTIFLNPSYWERKKWADLIIQNYNDRLPAAGYEKPVIYKNSEVTIDKFMNLEGYGIIHIYSHGWAWPSDINIQEVYLLTGEPWSNETFQKYEADITNGEIPIVKRNGTDFLISPDFIAKHNNFSADTTLIYGGFCYSYLGNWPGTMINTAKAGGYFGFDWSVWTSKNAKWNLDLMIDLLDTNQHPPITSMSWMNNNVTKWYWSHRNNRPVYIKYLGYEDLSLVEEDDFPKFNKCRISLNITLDIQLSSGEVNEGSVRNLTPEGEINSYEEGEENNTYYFEWNENSDGMNHSGNIELTINRNTMEIVSFNASSDETLSTGKEFYSFEGSQINSVIEYNEYLDNYMITITDEDVCNIITSLSYSYDFNNSWPDLNSINYYCDDSSYITISLYIE